MLDKRMLPVGADVNLCCCNFVLQAMVPSTPGRKSHHSRSHPLGPELRYKGQAFPEDQPELNHFLQVLRSGDEAREAEKTSSPIRKSPSVSFACGLYWFLPCGANHKDGNGTQGGRERTDTSRE